MTEVSREELVRIVNLVKPALATMDYIPAYKYINFSKNHATAYNDVAAISVFCELNIDRCIPGDLLGRALANMPGKNVVLQETGQTMLLSSGRSKLRLPMLMPADYPFGVPEHPGAPMIIVQPEILKGIEACMISVGNNEKRPATMGVTLDQSDGYADLYSTDNYSLSRFATQSKITLPGDSPVILPTFFCQQMSTLIKAFPGMTCSIRLIPGALRLDIDSKDGNEAVLFMKTLVDIEPLDFGKIMNRYGVDKIDLNHLLPIPDAFDAAFQRALLIVNDEVAKTCTVSVKAGLMTINAKSPIGTSEDVMPLEAGESIKFDVDPAAVLRASKSCSHLMMLPDVLVLCNADMTFTHIISHVSV